MRIKFVKCFAFAFALAMNANAQIPKKVESFNISNVHLTTSAFKHAEDMDISYLLGINPDRLLAPYLKEAGLTPKAQNYTNWESTGLDGHIGGHYLSALSYMYASTGNTEIKGRLEYFLSTRKRIINKQILFYILYILTFYCWIIPVFTNQLQESFHRFFSRNILFNTLFLFI